MNRLFLASAISCATSLFALQSASAITIDWTPVGNPGNAADNTTGYGDVGYAYNIDKYDVTVSQYVEFLNAKDPTGANLLGLYSSNMSNSDYGGINFTSGAAVGSKYTVVSGNGNHPANYVDWYNAIRFVNWLDNGQGNGNTETGAYTLFGGTHVPSNATSIARNTAATIFLPSEDEWYKAAYYDPNTSSYFQYPTSSNIAPTASGPTSLANHANYNNAVENLTNVGAYTGTTSPYGAFDMGGVVWNWNDREESDGIHRYARGGSWDTISDALLSSHENSFNATLASRLVGFRVAEVPEPDAFVIAITGLLTTLAYRQSKLRRQRCFVVAQNQL